MATSGDEFGLRVGHAEGEIDSAGPERRGADARFAGQAAVDVRHERGTLFVPRENETDFGACRRIDKPDVLLARNAEDVFDTFRFEARDHQIRGRFLNFTVAHELVPFNVVGYGTWAVRQAVSHMNPPIVTTERIVLKNSVEAISCSAVWYWTARITQIEAVGIAMVSTASRVISGATPTTSRRAHVTPGTTMLRVKTEMPVGREIATRREYRTMPEANRATPPVDLPTPREGPALLPARERRPYRQDRFAVKHPRWKPGA